VSGTGDDVPVRWEPDPDRPVLRVTLDRPAKLNALNDAIRVGLQRSLAAAEALEWGFLHRVVPAGELDTAVEALVDELVAQPALALAMTVDGLRALGRATSAPDTAWADADLLRWSLRDRRR